MLYVIITVGVVLLLLLVFLYIVSTKPDTFRIVREATLSAPPDKIFAILNDFHQWPSWSPWEKLDPYMKRDYSGSNSGIGAAYAWEGNKKVGAGRMEIKESHPASKLVVKLDFLKPFAASNTTEFILQSTSSGTHLTWAMYGPQPFMSKLMCSLINMDKLIGKDFETGLTNLKAHVEA